MIGGDHTALVSHQGVDRRELLDALRPRWPVITLKDLEDEEPVWEMTAEDAADLGTRRRGAEPLRVVIMPQRVTRVTVAPVHAAVLNATESRFDWAPVGRLE